MCFVTSLFYFIRLNKLLINLVHIVFFDMPCKCHYISSPGHMIVFLWLHNCDFELSVEVSCVVSCFYEFGAVLFIVGF